MSGLPPIERRWVREDENRSPEELDARREHLVEAHEEIEAHKDSLRAAERSLTVQWREDVPVDVFVAALRAMADALGQGQNFSFSVSHRFMTMRPIGTPSIQYYERENQRKVVTFRYSWEA